MNGKNPGFSHHLRRNSPIVIKKPNRFTERNRSRRDTAESVLCEISHTRQMTNQRHPDQAPPPFFARPPTSSLPGALDGQGDRGIPQRSEDMPRKPLDREVRRDTLEKGGRAGA